MTAPKTLQALKHSIKEVETSPQAADWHLGKIMAIAEAHIEAMEYASQETPHDTSQRIQIGEYEISHGHPGTYWICHDSGEGMGVDAKIFEAMIHNWYKENF